MRHRNGFPGFRLGGMAIAASFAVITLTSTRTEAAQSCESLTTLSLPNATITSAVAVAAIPTLRANCKVNGVGAKRVGA